MWTAGGRALLVAGAISGVLWMTKPVAFFDNSGNLLGNCTMSAWDPWYPIEYTAKDGRCAPVPAVLVVAVPAILMLWFS